MSPLLLGLAVYVWGALAVGTAVFARDHRLAEDWRSLRTAAAWGLVWPVWPLVLLAGLGLALAGFLAGGVWCWRGRG